MIAYMEGTILKVTQDGIVLLAGKVGYEIILPVFVMEKMIIQLSKQEEKPQQIASADKILDKIPDKTSIELTGQPISFYIYYYQTERQPKPILIGFNSEDEKEFFQIFISVDAIGPLKAVKAIEKSVSEIAMAIEQQDIDFLAGLKGIGKRTAQKIVASLHGKVSRFISYPNDNSEHSVNKKTDNLSDQYSSESKNRDLEQSQMLSSRNIIPISKQEIYQQVVDVLVEQLGYTAAIARKMVLMAIEKNPSIIKPEQLLDVVLYKK